MERMLRTIWFGDSSKEKETHLLAAGAGGIHEVSGQAGFAGAGVPDTRTLLPRK